MNLSDSLGAIRCQAGEKLSSSKWFSFFFLCLIIYDPQTWIPYRNQTCFVGDLEGHLWFLRHDRHPRNLRSGILLEHFWTVKTKPASRAIKLVGLISNWHSTHGELQLEKNWEANLSERMQIRSWLEMILIQSVVFFCGCWNESMQDLHDPTYLSNRSLGTLETPWMLFKMPLMAWRIWRRGSRVDDPPAPQPKKQGRTLVKAVRLSSLKENWWL